MAGSLNLNNRWEKMVKDIVGEAEFYRIKGDKCYLEPLDYFERVANRKFRGVEKKWIFHFFKAGLRDNRPKGLFSDTLVLTW